MKQPKDIFDLFRDNQHKLEERPSPRTWDRLERRLDQHRQRPRRQFPRLFSLVAAVVGLVAMITVISFMFRSVSSGDMAAADAPTAIFVVEDLNTSPENERGFYDIVEFQNKYNDRLANPIREGQPRKRLMARAERPVNLSPSTDLLLAEATPTIEQAPVVLDSEIATPEPTAELMSPATEAVAGIGDEVEDVVVSSYALSEADGYAEAPGAKDEIAEAPATEKLSASRARAKRETQLNSTQDNSVVNGLPVAEGLSQFQWLLGKWQGVVNAKISVEQWQQLDARTLKGTGFLVVDGKTTFVEGMNIQQIGSDVYFIADLDGDGQTVQYLLKSNNGQLAIFENQDIDFPNQVIIQKTNLNNFTTIYQNAAPVIEPTLEQQNYLNNRNMMNVPQQQVSRSLRRVED